MPTYVPGPVSGAGHIVGACFPFGLSGEKFKSLHEVEFYESLGSKVFGPKGN